MKDNRNRADLARHFAALRAEVERSLPAVALPAKELGLLKPGTSQVELPTLDASKTVVCPVIVKTHVHLKVCGSWAAHALPAEQ